MVRAGRGRGGPWDQPFTAPKKALTRSAAERQEQEHDGNDRYRDWGDLETLRALVRRTQDIRRYEPGTSMGGYNQLGRKRAVAAILGGHPLEANS
jgi:hypothetical protein